MGRKLYCIFLTFVLVAGSAGGAWATSSPQATVEKLLDAIKKIKGGDSISSDQKSANRKFAEMAMVYLDLPDVGEKTLGKHWNVRSQKEKEDFVSLLSSLFEKVAFPSSAKFFAELNVVYGESKIDKQDAVVPLTVQHANEGAIHIDFKLHSNSGQWKVYDVVLDDVSMRNNLKTQFQRVIGEHDYKELVRRIKDKIEKSEN